MKTFLHIIGIIILSFVISYALLIIPGKSFAPFEWNEKISDAYLYSVIIFIVFSIVGYFAYIDITKKD